MDLEEYDKYYKHFLLQHNGGNHWHYGAKIFAQAYKYHDGDWQKTLSLASDFLTVYHWGYSN